MNSVDIIFLINGIIVLFGVVMFLRFLKVREESQFRDDIWDEKHAPITKEVDRLAWQIPKPEEMDEDTIEIERPAHFQDDDTLTDVMGEQTKTDAQHPGGETDTEIKEELKARKKTQAKTQTKKQSKDGAFNLPRFGGTPEQILGVKSSASKQEVIQAYRYWIKRYHPDRVSHLGKKHAKIAHVRAEQLTDAKDQLLKRFK